jgi:opacity protein-like surface antigen
MEEIIMKSRLSLLVAGLAVLATVAQAADVSGKWVAQVPGRGGAPRETTFNFTVDGEHLTGTMSGRQGDLALTDGKVKGDELSFTVSMGFPGSNVRFAYKGKVVGDEIQFTRQREGAERSQEFSAKRAK